MLEQAITEVRLEDEEVLLELIVGLHLVLLLDRLLPHAHELPALELLEEAEVLDVIVGVALDEPLTEGLELHGGVLLVEGETFARDGVVLIPEALIEADWLQVVGVVLVGTVQIGENCLFLAAGIEQQLNILVELAPLLRLLGLLAILLAQVVDHIRRLSIRLGLGT